jgi:hypothetical protein
MDFTSTFLLTIILACSVKAIDESEEENAFRQKLFGSLYRNLRNRELSENPELTRLHSYGNLDSPSDFAFPSIHEHFFEENTKRSPLYRMNKPISLRQTRLAAFGTMLVPKVGEKSAQKVWRYG